MSAITDAIDETDLEIIGKAASSMPFSVGASGLGLGLVICGVVLLTVWARQSRAVRVGGPRPTRVTLAH